MSGRRFVILLLLLSLPLAGCHHAAMIHPRDLRHLDGYTLGEVRSVPTLGGENYRFGVGTAIVMRLTGNRVIKAWYRAIEVDGNTFRGIDKYNRVTELDLSDIREFHVFTKNRPLTTAAIMIPIALGTAGLVAIVILIASCCDDSDDDGL